MPKINETLCIGCGKCVDVCGFNALTIKGDLAVSDNEKCISCGMCKFHCPVDAITTPKIKSPKNAELIKNWANTYAEANGFKLNPDEKIVDTIIKGLLAKEEKQGKRYCPCRIAPVSENVCPCVYHKDEIEKDGACHCLFFIV